MFLNMEVFRYRSALESVLGAILDHLGPSWTSKQAQNLFKTGPESNQMLDHFFDYFWSRFGGHVGAQNGARIGSNIGSTVGPDFGVLPPAGTGPEQQVLLHR